MRPARLLLAAPVLALLTAAPAFATTYCVGDAACPADGVEHTFVDAVSAALASRDADTIRLGSGGWGAPGGTLRLRGDDALVGSGPVETSIAGVLDTDGRVAVRDLRVTVAPGQAAGVRANGGTLDDVVVGPAAASVPGGAVAVDPGAVGIVASGGVKVDDSRVALPAGTGLTEVGGATVTDTEIAAPTGVTASYYGLALRRVRIDAHDGVVARDGAVDVESTVIRLSGNGGVGVQVGPGASTPRPATVTHATILGDRSRGQLGVAVRSECDLAASATVSATAIGELAYPLARSVGCAEPGAPKARLAVTRSAYDPAGVLDSGPRDTPSSPIEAPVATTLRLGADLVPLAGSPLVDAADPAEAAGLDLRGAKRPQDGDGDGTAVADVGALERAAAPGATTPATDGPAANPAPEDPAAAPGASGAGGQGGGATPPAQSGVAGQSDAGTAAVRGPRPRIRVARIPGRRRAFRAVVTVPQATAGTIELATAAGKREFRVRTKRLGRSGRVAYRIELPRGVRRKAFGMRATFRPADGGPARASRWTGLF